jgi:hypothetical protein
LRWAIEGPEEFPIDTTQFAELVRQVNAEAIRFMQGLVPWMASVEVAARALDTATAAVAEGCAIVTGDAEPQCVSIFAPGGAAHA